MDNQNVVYTYKILLNLKNKIDTCYKQKLENIMVREMHQTQNVKHDFIYMRYPE